MSNTPRANADRLIDSIAAMARIGALPGGGCRRLALSAEDKAARDIFADWCREAGCTVSVDRFGNMLAWRAGSEEGPAIAFGSHLDTQPNGGRFDGIYGVLAGLEVMRALHDRHQRTRRPLLLVNWTNEEGVSFAPGLTGSKGFAGLLDEAAVSALRGSDGVSFDDSLAAIGYAGTASAPPLAAYLEAHIEQGPILEASGSAIGVVTGVQGVRWFEVHIKGADRHAGTTPMELRQDSFMATARIALALRRVALGISPDVRLTIGRVAVDPGSINTVPGAVAFTIDLRHPRTATLDEVETALGHVAVQEGTAEGCAATIAKIFDLPPIDFDKGVIAAVGAAASVAGQRAQPIVSGAMHDACPLATLVPTGMIFIPCKGGISHNESEDVDPAHLVAGADVLLATVLALAG